MSSASPQANRRPLIAANWKMNKNVLETEAFVRDFAKTYIARPDRDVVICPPFTSLVSARQALEGTAIHLGAQNINENDSGAFTGEISGGMLVSTGCRFVIIGHSERRQFFGETDVLVKKKIVAALRHQLTPIVCVGETLAEREANKTIPVVDRQIRAALEGLPSADLQKLVFAYEPIWAIGTGKTATPAQAQEVHLAIRDILKDLYGSHTSLLVRILYGGSVKPDNMAELMACEDVDGGLVGGASLDAKSFLGIAEFGAFSKAPGK